MVVLADIWSSAIFLVYSVYQTEVLVCKVLPQVEIFCKAWQGYSSGGSDGGEEGVGRWIEKIVYLIFLFKIPAIKILLKK